MTNMITHFRAVKNDQGYPVEYPLSSGKVSLFIFAKDGLE